MPNLTAKQEAFCQGVASGLTQSDAYRQAYNASKMSDKTIWERAAVLVKDSKVAARVTELRDELARKRLWTREKSIAVLGSIAASKQAKESDKISAVKELNAMHGFNAAQKVDLTSSDRTMSPQEPKADLSKLDLETLLKLRETITGPDSLRD